VCVTAALFAPAICAAQTLPAQSSSVTLRRVSDALDAGQYDVAEQIASAAYSPFEPPTPPTLNALPSLRLLLAAKVKNGKSADNETVTLAARALNVIMANPAVSVEDTAATSEIAASLFVERGEYSQARRLYETAFAIRSRAIGTNTPQLADSLDGLGAVLIQTQNLQEAAIKIAASLEVRQRAGSPPRTIAHTLLLVALVHRFQGEYERALKEMDDVQALEERASHRHPDLVAVHQIRGEIFFLQGNMSAAEAEFTTALEIARQTLRAEHPASIA
jgi:tetratricopeptide (TPR) repeat protein